MKQVLQHARTGEITVAEVPAPQLLPGCAMVRIAASVVSPGTERASAEFAAKNLWEKAMARPDLVREVIGKIQRDGILAAVQTVRSRLDQPQVPGYSSAGVVTAVAEGLTDIQIGDRVACAGAGIAVHAELACVPRLLMARIPQRSADDSAAEVPFEEAAFGTLGAVAIHGIRTADVRLGDLVAVIGLGLIGQLTVQLLRATGCRVLGMDIDPARAALGREQGALEVASSPAEFRQLCSEQSRGLGVDSVLIAAETRSSDPVNLAGVIARDRAVVVAVGTVGMDIERKAYYEKELDFRISRSYGPGRYDAAFEQKGRDYPIGYVRWTETRNLEAFLQMLAERRVRVAPLITHRFPVERAESAYEVISGRSEKHFLGVVIQYPGTCKQERTLHLAPPASSDAAPAAVTGDVSVGILGAGVFATGTLLPALKLDRAKLVGICAATGVHADQAARKFDFRYATTDEEQLLRDPVINTIVVATRHHLHANQVLCAIAAGKHVLCEKPLCLTEDELRSLVRAYLGTQSPQRRALMVGFNRRFAPMIQRVKTFFTQTREPLALTCRVNAGPLKADHWVNDPEQGGGRILGEACHFVDLLMYLAGSPIVAVEARAVANSGRYSGENVIVALRFANGSEGSIAYLANGDRGFSKERLEIFGGGSVAIVDDFRRLELARDGRKQTHRSLWRQDKGHRSEWKSFADSIRAGSAAPIPFDELVCSTLATLRVQESAVAGTRLEVDTPAFIDAALHDSGPGSPRRE